MGLGIHGAIGGHIYGYIGIHQVGSPTKCQHDPNICTRIYIIHNKMNSLSR